MTEQYIFIHMLNRKSAQNGNYKNGWNIFKPRAKGEITGRMYIDYGTGR